MFTRKHANNARMVGFASLSPPYVLFVSFVVSSPVMKRS